MEEKKWFQRFYLDKEKDMIVDLYRTGEDLGYVLRTPNHGTGNLISNLAKLCGLPVSFDREKKMIIEGEVPSYIDTYNRTIYIFRLGGTKVANIFPDGTVEMKASIPAISKTLMSQTKDYRLDIKKTIVKTFIPRACKFHTDLHTHMNANLSPDILIALGIVHQIRYPLYYIKKLGLKCSPAQLELLENRRGRTAEQFADSPLTGKYLQRKIDDNTFINFADLILNNEENAAYNIPKIRASLAIMKDGQAVFTNLEKVYLYRYVFAKGNPSDEGEQIDIGRFFSGQSVPLIPDADIERYVRQMLRDREDPRFKNNSIFQDKLLWIARSAGDRGVQYLEISDTTLVKNPQAAHMLEEVHKVMPAVVEETGVLIRFLAAIRRIPLTIVRDSVSAGDYFRENLQVLAAVAADPYVAGADLIGEEINDVRDLRPVIHEITKIASEHPGFVVRIHAGENDSLRDNVANSIACVRESLMPGQVVPPLRIGHGLYTANLKSRKGKQLIEQLRESGTVLEFQITSNVRLNNLTSLEEHPLRQYLAGGVRCVQGTDGGAIYGTDSIDEQLSLEKLLNLSEDELLRMRESEDEVLASALKNFEQKQEQVQTAWTSDGITDIEAWYREQIDARRVDTNVSFIDENKLVSQEVLGDRICELPPDGTPLVLLGGSFNNDLQHSSMQEGGRALIDGILDGADPDKVFFVVGQRLRSYERYLIEQNRTCHDGRFRIYAMIPNMITPAEERRIRKSGVSVRISIEPAAMGIYKSFAYEIFKRRPSVLLALEGNSAGANMIQEAKNAKYRCRTYINSHARFLRTKADYLEGYVTLFSKGSEALPQILRDLEKA